MPNNIFARLAMRTRFEIVIADEIDPADARAASEEAFDEIERLESQLSAYRPESALAYLNAHAAIETVRVEPRLFKLLQRAMELCEQTQGAFDISAGPLIDCWGFSDPGGAGLDLKIGSAGFEEQLALARELVGMRANVELDSQALTVRFAHRGVRLDPGAIGKGFALDCAMEILRDAGIRNALLHGGTSSVCAMGAPPGAAGWRIAIQNPLDPGAHLAEACLQNRSLGVSAVHGKSFRADGRRLGHVIDPRSGRPVANSVLAAFVTESAAAADAFSTALLVLGAEGMPSLEQTAPAASMLCVAEDSKMRMSGSSFAPRP